MNVTRSSSCGIATIHSEIDLNFINKYKLYKWCDAPEPSVHQCNSVNITVLTELIIYFSTDVVSRDQSSEEMTMSLILKLMTFMLGDETD